MTRSLDVVVTPRVCELCGTRFGLVLDHCHECGYSRGLLCRSCNILESVRQGHEENTRRDGTTWNEWRARCALDEQEFVGTLWRGLSFDRARNCARNERRAEENWAW